MKLTKQEEQELLFKKWREWQNTDLTQFCKVFAGLVQNDITITKDDLKKSIREFKRSKELTVAAFEKMIEETDELANDTIKFVYKHMID